MLAYRLPVIALAVVTLTVQSVRADTPSLEKLIDEQIDAKLKADGITPAGQADDATIVRRLTLDLVGRVPTPPELDTYIRSTQPNKRAKLVDRLMASPAYARYQAILFDVMLSDRPGQGGGKTSLREYLTTAIQDKRPWDQMFRDLMLPDDSDPKKKGASEFLRPKLSDMDKLTSDVSVAFFGVNVSCAQCHDHPLVKDWTQDHFYGMKSFLARTYDAGGYVAEKPVGIVKYKPNKGAEKKAQMMFLTGSPISTETSRELTAEEQKKDKEMVEKSKTDKKAPPAPAYSARAQLVEVALKPNEANYFAKSIANRLWHRFYGWGLVNPLDQLHSENQASHPELLMALASDTVSHKYDLNRMVRGYVMTTAYSRSSRYESAAFPSPSSFAVARLRALTPQQLATSLKIATSDPKNFEGKPDEQEKKAEQAESSARGFASLIAQPTDNFQIGVNEALLFSNGDRIQKEYLTDSGGTLLGRVKAEKDTEAALRLLVQTALGRPATSDELSALKAFVDARKDRQPEAYKQVLWALLASPEFRFNH